MSMTWKELQEVCLRKMDSLDEVNLKKDSNNTAYLNAMPSAVNEALLLLATDGRYWKKLMTITLGEEGGTILGGYTAYDLSEYADNFYCLDSVRLINGDGYDRYEDYLMESDHVMLVPTEEAGTLRIWYAAYPKRITATTAETEEIDIHPEAASIIACYVAGQLYKHDDISIAQIYMNEFFEWLTHLQESGRNADNRNAGGGEWSSVTGWC